MGGGLWDPNELKTGGPLSLLSFQPLTSYFGRLAHDWIVSPRMLNHLMLFYNRFMTERAVAPDVVPSAKYDGLKVMGITGLAPIAGFPSVNWNSGPFVSGPGIGYAAGNKNPAMGFGFLDTVSFASGRHFMKAGFDFRRNHDNFRPVAWPTFNFSAAGTAIPNEVFSGNFTGYSFASYLLGIVSSAGYSDPIGLGERRRYYAVFFQDDFKVSKKLSLNLGLRWDYQPPTSEVADRISSWNPNKIDPASGLRGAYDFAGSCNVCTGKHSFGRASLRNWSPRLGFAYRPFEKWTIRGAYGIMYEADLFAAWGIPGGKAGSVQVGGTYSLSADPVQPWLGAFNWDNGFPTNRYTPAAYDVSWANLNSAWMYDPEYGRTGYVQQWNLNIQREIPGHLVVEVGYVGNKGTGLRNGELKRLNQLPPSVLSTYGRNLSNAIRSPADAAANGIPYPYPGFQGTVATAIRQFPQVRSSTITVYSSPLGFSTYHSLQVVVNRQFGRGLGIYANYVWSKQMSNMSSAQIGANHGPLDYYNLSLEKAVGENNVPQMFKAYLDYQLPFGRGKTVWSSAGKIPNAIFGGWSLSGILNYSSGSGMSFGGSGAGSGWNGATNRANIAPGNMKVENFDKSAFEYSTPLSPNNTYLNKSLFSDPPPLTLGTSAYRYIQVRGFARINENFTLQKEHTIAEKYRIQLRVDFLNAFNRQSLGGPNTSITSANFGQVTSKSGNRTIQLGARLNF